MEQLEINSQVIDLSEKLIGDIIDTCKDLDRKCQIIIGSCLAGSTVLINEHEILVGFLFLSSVLCLIAMKSKDYGTLGIKPNIVNKLSERTVEELQKRLMYKYEKEIDISLNSNAKKSQFLDYGIYSIFSGFFVELCFHFFGG